MSESPLPPWPWDHPPRSLIQSIVKSLITGLRDDDSFLYLLVDPALGDPPDLIFDDDLTLENVQQARETAWGIPVFSLHSTDFPSSTVLNFPYLVRFDASAEEQLSHSVQWAIEEHLRACHIGSGTYRIGGWLQLHTMPLSAPEAGRALAHKLAMLLQYRNAQHQPKTIRICDRRVLHALRQGTELDWDSALQGIASWHHLDYNVTLQTLQGHTGPLEFNPLLHNGQYDTFLEQMSAITIAQTTMLNHTFPLRDDTLPKIRAQVDAAIALGLEYPEDQGAYAAEILNEPAFARWPGLDDAIHYVIRTRQNLSAVLKQHRSEWAGKPADFWPLT